MAGITEDRFIRKRVLKLVYLSIATLFAGVLLGALHRMALGDILVLLFLDVLFAVSFIFYLETSRLHKKHKRPDSAEDYQRLGIYYTAGILFYAAGVLFSRLYGTRILHWILPGCSIGSGTGVCNCTVFKYPYRTGSRKLRHSNGMYADADAPWNCDDGYV